jgi:hypothetical protein
VAGRSARDDEAGADDARGGPHGHRRGSVVTEHSSNSQDHRDSTSHNHEHNRGDHPAHRPRNNGPKPFRPGSRHPTQTADHEHGPRHHHTSGQPGRTGHRLQTAELGGRGHLDQQHQHQGARTRGPRVAGSHHRQRPLTVVGSGQPVGGVGQPVEVKAPVPQA